MKWILEALSRWLGGGEPRPPLDGPAWKRDYNRGCE